jgi:hypothetical protein
LVFRARTPGVAATTQRAEIVGDISRNNGFAGDAHRFSAFPQSDAAQIRLPVHRRFGHSDDVDIAAGGPRG